MDKISSKDQLGAQGEKSGQGGNPTDLGLNAGGKGQEPSNRYHPKGRHASKQNGNVKKEGQDYADDYRDTIQGSHENSSAMLARATLTNDSVNQQHYIDIQENPTVSHTTMQGRDEYVANKMESK